MTANQEFHFASLMDALERGATLPLDKMAELHAAGFITEHNESETEDDHE